MLLTVGLTQGKVLMLTAGLRGIDGQGGGKLVGKWEMGNGGGGGGVIGE